MPKFVRYTSNSQPQWGAESDGSIYSLSSLQSPAPDFADFANPAYREYVKEAIATNSLSAVPEGDVKRLSPVSQPGQIICLGLNYRDHAEEQNEDIPEKPLLFAKSPNSVTNPGDPIVRPPNVEKLDYEVELAIVIGRMARNVDTADARSVVAGYTIMNDVSARGAQFEDGQWFRGKSYRTFAPLGPVLVAGESFKPNETNVELTVNGEVRQSSTTSEFIFDIDHVISYISRITTLRPGDVIATGTPGGVGIFRDPPTLLEPGDTVTAAIEDIGKLTNEVVADTG